MDISEIKPGVTYVGPLDYVRGLGSHRTALSVGDDLVLFRVEVGATPPTCYVSHASMLLEDFAAWAVRTQSDA